MRSIFVCILLAAPALSQQFEVVSIKPNNSMSGDSDSRTDQGMMTGTNISLRRLILRAYGIKDYQLEGPDWLSSEHFDISAKIPETVSAPRNGREQYKAAFESMMQSMLAERFKFAAHRDHKTMGVYALVVGKNGIKFKQVPPGGPSNSSTHNTHYTGAGVSMDRFAEVLSQHTEIPVLDFTGLKGVYELKLDWQGKDDNPDAASGPSLTEAVQDQLGLRMERRKAPVEILVVDHVEKTPTDN
jgi:uncharacterized protein (TIGR03435 family)